jgi:PAS domain S-box-containing protein
MNEILIHTGDKSVNLAHFFQSLLDLLPDLVCYIDKSHRFRFANKAYLKFFNIKPSAMIGLHPWDVLGDKAYKTVELHHKAALSGQFQNYRSSLTLPNGELMYFQAKYQPNIVDDKVEGFLSIVRDITVQEKRKQDIKEKTEELEKTNTALEVLLERRNRQLEALKETIHRNFTQTVLPDLELIKDRLKIESNRKTISLIIQNMSCLLSPNTSDLASSKYGLTKTEIKIATMIRNGMTSLEIANHLNISSNTVGFHRKNLRKKFGLTGSAGSLQEHLSHQS